MVHRQRQRSIFVGAGGVAGLIFQIDLGAFKSMAAQQRCATLAQGHNLGRIGDRQEWPIPPHVVAKTVVPLHAAVIITKTERAAATITNKGGRVRLDGCASKTDGLKMAHIFSITVGS